MNSLIDFFKITGTAAAISFLMIIYSPRADCESFDSYGPKIHAFLSPAHVAEQERSARRKARKAALSAAKELVSKTAVWKKINRFKENFAERYSFEFKKNFSPEYPLKNDDTPSSGIKNETAREIFFSGRFNEKLSPVFEFGSKFRSIDIFGRFDILDHKLDFEITSPPVNRFIGGETRLGVASDGVDSEAVFKMVFDF